MTGNIDYRSEHQPVEAPEQIICAVCGGVSPPNLANCMWCGRPLPSGTTNRGNDPQALNLLARSLRPMLLGFSVVIIALLINVVIWNFFGVSIITHPFQFLTNSTPPNSGADYGHFFTDLIFGGINLLLTIGILLLGALFVSFALVYGVTRIYRLLTGTPAISKSKLKPGQALVSWPMQNCVIAFQ